MQESGDGRSGQRGHGVLHGCRGEATRSKICRTDAVSSALPERYRCAGCTPWI
ncbi:Hypothetical protein A7982_07475 [Minicystis rosea]|nr:Hypothetical protein A7982_07475 [Minicystis rosea]